MGQNGTVSLRLAALFTIASLRHTILCSASSDPSFSYPYRRFPRRKIPFTSSHTILHNSYHPQDHRMTSLFCYPRFHTHSRNNRFLSILLFQYHRKTPGNPNWRLIRQLLQLKRKDKFIIIVFVKGFYMSINNWWNVIWNICQLYSKS